MKIKSGMIAQTFQRFGEDKEEYSKVLFLVLYLFAITSASTIGRTAADALFLSHFGASQLSFMYVPQSAALILVGFLFQRISPRFRMDQLLYVLIPILSSLVLLSRLGVGLDFKWVYPVIYVGYDVFNFLMVVCFWQFATSVLDQRKVKRTIGLVGSGGLIGSIVSGFGLKAVAPLVGTPNLIFFYAGMQLIALVAVVQLTRRSDVSVFAVRKQQPNTGAKKKQPAKESKGGMFHHVPHLKYVAIMSAALVITLTLIDYQFKVILKSTLENDELAGFMGSFYGYSGLLALFVQLFIAGKLLTRFGVMAAILVFPIALFTGSLGVLLMPVLAMVVIVKGSDKVLGDTINSSVNQLIMFPVPPEWRNQAKSFLDGIVRNGAKGVAAIGLIALSQLLTTPQFSYVILALLTVCIFAAVKVKGAYLQALLSTLKTRGHDLQEGQLDLMDPASLAVLTGTLTNPEKGQVLYALKILQEVDGFDLMPHMEGLLQHPAQEVRVEALRYMERVRPAGQEETLLAQMQQEGHSLVQAGAVLALSAYAKEEYLDEITARLTVEDMDVKSAAIAGHIKYYGIEGMFRAVGTLKQLMESSHEDERTRMAILFGQIGIRGFYKPLIPLLRDDSPQVRKYAVQSAALLGVTELVPHIVPLLTHNETREPAVEALAAYEEKVILPLLAPYFEMDAALLYLPKVFERIGGQAAFDVLMERYPASGFELRDKLLEAMSRMRKGISYIDAKRIEMHIYLELDLYWKFTAYQRDMGGAEGYSEVAEAIEQSRLEMIKRIFQLLGFMYDASTISAVYVNWSEGQARQQANAAEVIDQLVQGNLRMELAKLMAAPRIIAPSAAGTGAGTAASREQSLPNLDWLYDQGEEWLCQVIQFAAARRGERIALGKATGAEAGDSGDAALTAQVDEAWLGDQMDRIEMLKKVSLFEGLTGRELAAFALRMEQLVYPQGSTVFRQGDPGDALYIIRSGRTAVYQGSEKVNERIAGETFGQTAILTHRLRTATVVAEEELVLLRLDSAAFYDVMFDRTGIALEMMRLLSRRLRSKLARTAAAPASQAEQEVAASMESVETEASNAHLMQSETILRRVLILQKIELFARLSQEDVIKLAQAVEEVEYAPGESVCKVDDYGDTLYGIIEGNIRIHKGSETFATLGEGEYFGEMAVIDSGLRSADCTAVGRTVVLQLHRDQVFALCFQNIDVLRSMMQVLADRLRGMLL
ncbi:Npt1/Npt2 family nucleotide transporter [Paenibacillus sp. OV219]|uniref:Npt1/Npt2 family nucleotide transporter n=1 Tax=Paenibacillus sp. OV219 TaxID=1884377 RepID=UPI0008CA04F9|nr:Npt1/Npt2 family nucleotide transporter [Paenibacillus sp. OV219]SEO35875.1 ATP/ADP translocase [Paenibacillus sp. OV219]